MASAKVGDGFGRPIANNSRQLQVRGSSSGLLHQMGGSKGIGKYHTPTIQKFFWQNIICRFGVPRANC
jgi:hypothetical protein